MSDGLSDNYFEDDSLPKWMQKSNKFKMKTMATAPRDERYIILFGDNGYSTTPLRCEMCRYDAQYRPLQPWVNHTNDSFEDSGGSPIDWINVPSI